MDEEYCVLKSLLEKKLEEEPDLENRILEFNEFVSLKECYFCDGYNYNCPGYVKPQAYEK